MAGAFDSRVLLQPVMLSPAVPVPVPVRHFGRIVKFGRGAAAAQFDAIEFLIAFDGSGGNKLTASDVRRVVLAAPLTASQLAAEMALKPATHQTGASTAVSVRDGTVAVAGSVIAPASTFATSHSAPFQVSSAAGSFVSASNATLLPLAPAQPLALVAGSDVKVAPILRAAAAPVAVPLIQKTGSAASQRRKKRLANLRARTAAAAAVASGTAAPTGTSTTDENTTAVADGDTADGDTAATPPAPALAASTAAGKVSSAISSRRNSTAAVTAAVESEEKKFPTPPLAAIPVTVVTRHMPTPSAPAAIDIEKSSADVTFSPALAPATAPASAPAAAAETNTTLEFAGTIVVDMPAADPMPPPATPQSPVLDSVIIPIQRTAARGAVHPILAPLNRMSRPPPAPQAVERTDDSKYGRIPEVELPEIAPRRSSGVVKRISDKFGFIACPELPYDVFFLFPWVVAEYSFRVRVGDAVEFELHPNPKPKADHKSRRRQNGEETLLVAKQIRPAPVEPIVPSPPLIRRSSPPPPMRVDTKDDAGTAVSPPRNHRSSADGMNVAFAVDARTQFARVQRRVTRNVSYVADEHALTAFNRQLSEPVPLPSTPTAGGSLPEPSAPSANTLLAPSSPAPPSPVPIASSPLVPVRSRSLDLKPATGAPNPAPSAGLDRSQCLFRPIELPTVDTAAQMRRAQQPLSVCTAVAGCVVRAMPVFLNSDSGGVIFVGVNRSGGVAGVEMNESECRNVTREVEALLSNRVPAIQPRPNPELYSIQLIPVHSSTNTNARRRFVVEVHVSSGAEQSAVFTNAAHHALVLRGQSGGIHPLSVPAIIERTRQWVIKQQQRLNGRLSLPPGSVSASTTAAATHSNSGDTSDAQQSQHVAELVEAAVKTALAAAAVADDEKKAAAAAPANARSEWEKQNDADAEAEAVLPDDFACPLSLEVMLDPVVADDGFTYDRKSIESWFLKHAAPPVVTPIIVPPPLIPSDGDSASASASASAASTDAIAATAAVAAAAGTTTTSDVLTDSKSIAALAIVDKFTPPPKASAAVEDGAAAIPVVGGPGGAATVVLPPEVVGSGTGGSSCSGGGTSDPFAMFGVSHVNGRSPSAAAVVVPDVLLSPMTGKPLRDKRLVPNQNLKSQILEWLTKHKPKPARAVSANAIVPLPIPAAAPPAAPAIAAPPATEVVPPTAGTGIGLELMPSH